ncbi:hypothetical protein [Reichenbachiella sp.]|uniref:hypothetical protein n=1 Tax=Reichenbachiella sp. TaxID=2184521 RepID=UPI003B5AF1A4
MTKFKYSIAIGASILILGHLYVMNYNDLSWSNNVGAYLGIISMIFLLIATIFNIRDAKRKSQ